MTFDVKKCRELESKATPGECIACPEVHGVDDRLPMVKLPNGTIALMFLGSGKNIPDAELFVFLRNNAVAMCDELERAHEINAVYFELAERTNAAAVDMPAGVKLADVPGLLRERLEAAERVVSSAEKYMAYVVGMDVHSYRGEDGDCDYCDVEDPLKEALVDYEAAVKS